MVPLAEEGPLLFFPGDSKEEGPDGDRGATKGRTDQPNVEVVLETTGVVLDDPTFTPRDGPTTN